MSELSYKPLHISYLNELTAIWSDPEVIYYTNIKKPCSMKEIEARVNRLESKNTYVIQKGDTTIGIIGCPPMDDDSKSFGLFYQLRKDCWGNGFASKAVQWMLAFMKEKYPGSVIYADVVEENLASKKILSHFDFHFIAKEKTFIRDGVKMSILNYMLELPR
jgi:RimJ/RimL family protein N-acetyltransferase